MRYEIYRNKYVQQRLRQDDACFRKHGLVRADNVMRPMAACVDNWYKVNVLWSIWFVAEVRASGNNTWLPIRSIGRIYTTEITQDDARFCNHGLAGICGVVSTSVLLFFLLSFFSLLRLK
ncbi:unnamed protein product [Cylicostephanus goldi]|uniref:Uncharacterized protein n=1 Tax=Cylicostephanus goldi TaxID=71465 RepID=A0A3P6S521_CYLGO|nr:unnamed protein product [Cylicostephanus goldi]